MSTPENPSENNSHPWLRGAAVSGIGVVIGIVSLVLFCHALGLNLRDQGWGSGSDSWNTNRGRSDRLIHRIRHWHGHLLAWFPPNDQAQLVTWSFASRR